ncbi:MAG: sensor histidine kinase [Spirochaetia bacterium]|nr:sensor histidine kinase [Spirochaetia bacterium]
MKKHSRALSLKRRLFLTMLAISILPVLIITTLASVNTYNRIYHDIIKVNTEGMNWTQQQLDSLAKDLKELYYSMEFDQGFKDAVLQESDGKGSFQSSLLIRDMLLAKLNVNRAISYFQISFADQNHEMYADRARVTIGEKTQARWIRPDHLQTNLFFIGSEERILAVHNIHRFPDRQLLAQQSAAMRDDVFLQILSTLQIYDNEQIFLINDEFETLMQIPAGELPIESLLGMHESSTVNMADDVLYTEQAGNLIFSTIGRQEPLSIIKVVPKSEISRSILPTIYTGIILGIFSLLLSVVLSAILSSVISKPVVSLAQRVKNIELESLVLEEDEKTSDEVKVLEDHIALFVERIRQLIRNEYDITLQSKTAQINALQAQINPHFLHNTLQLMGSIALSKGDDEVYRVSHALSSLMRYSMDFNERSVPLEEELNSLNNYLFIQKERFSDRMSVEFIIAPDVKDVLVPKLLLQPIVENAFMHGFESKSGFWKLTILAYSDDEKLHIIVKDNGCGMPPSEVDRINAELKTQHTGALISITMATEHIGLKNVNERIRLTSSIEDGVTVSSVQGEGTTIEIVCTQHRRA